MSQQLTEHVADWNASLTVEEESRTIKGVALVGQTSRNGYTYTEAALTTAVSLYDGKQVYLDHKIERARNRSVRDLAGTIINPRFEGGRVRGDIQTFDTESGRALFALAKANAPGVGFSHVVLANRSADGKTVESIEDVISVDAVTNPATTTRFSESHDPPTPEAKTVPELTLETLRAQNPQLVAQIEQTTREQTTATLKAEHKTALDAAIAQARDEGMQAERTRLADIRALCDQAQAPQLFETFCQEGTTVEAVRVKLFDHLCEQNTPPSRTTPENNGIGDGNDPDKKFKEEYKQNRETYVTSGITEAAYVRMRRIDEGLDVLAVGSEADAK